MTEVTEEMVIEFQQDPVTYIQKHPVLGLMVLRHMNDRSMEVRVAEQNGIDLATIKRKARIQKLMDWTVAFTVTSIQFAIWSGVVLFLVWGVKTLFKILGIV